MESTSPFSPERNLEPGLCTGCGVCVRVCPSSAIAADSSGHPRTFDAGACIGCAHCAAFCPENAFGLDRKVSADFGAAGLESLLAARRSIRTYSSRVPSREDLQRLCETVLSRAPTGTNSCGLEVRMVGGARLRGMVATARRAARLLGYLGLRHLAGAMGMRKVMEGFLEGEDMIFRNAPVAAFVFSSRKSSTGRDDGVIAATLMSLAARTMGMGTLWNGVARILYRVLPGWRLPRTRGLRLSTVICLGYPELNPLWQVPARPYGLGFHGIGSDTPKTDQPSGKTTARGAIR